MNKTIRRNNKKQELKMRTIMILMINKIKRKKDQMEKV